MKKIALVGGSGFIGTATAKELQKYGHDVTVIDIRPTSVSDINYIFANATDLASIKSALKYNFDCVFMFAAVSDSSENIKDPLGAIELNIKALANTLQAVSDLCIPRIIFSSTVWVYGTVNSTNVNETSDIIMSNSDHIYTTTKIAGEALVRNYHKISNIDYTILRYGIAYGPGCHPDTVFSKFITNSLTGKPLKITGDGSIYRNFLYVTDHARGNRLAMCDAAKNQIINLEGAEKITLKSVAEIVKDIHPEPVCIEYTGERMADYKGKNVSNEKAGNLLGWEPLVDLKTGVYKLYNHIKQCY